MAEEAHSSISIPNGDTADFDADEKKISDMDLSCVTETGAPIVKLYIRNLPNRSNPKNLAKIFEAYGNVKNIHLIKHFYPYAFVEYYNTKDALEARLAEVKYKSKILKVSPAKVQPADKKNANMLKKNEKISTKKARGEKQNCRSKKNYIDMLNDDCLQKIFLELSIRDRTHVQRVCKRWNRVSQQAWPDIHTLNIKYNLVWTITSKENPRHEVIYINNVKSVKKILKSCGRFLHTLTVHSFEPSSHVPNLIINYCYNITKLKMELCFYSRKIMSKMFHKCQKLTSLSMTSNEPYFINNCIIDVEKCPLTELRLDGASSKLDKFTNFSPTAIHVLKNFSGLHTLSLRCLDLKETQFAAISEITTLTDVSFAHCRCSDGSLNFFGNMSQLKRLNLEGASPVSDALLAVLAEKCCHLRYLNISQCQATNMGIQFLRRLYHLETLVINDTNVSGDGLWQISNLKTLDCQRSEVDDSNIIKVLKNVPGLKYLDLRMTAITDLVITEATKIIPNRNNGVILKMIIDGDITHREYRDSIPFLVIEVHRDDSDDSIDYDSEGDHYDDEFEYSDDDMRYMDYNIYMSYDEFGTSFVNFQFNDY